MPLIGILANEGTKWPDDAGVGDQNFHRPPGRDQTGNGGFKFAIFADVSAQTEGGTAGMFDFQFRGIEFSLVTAQNADSCASTGEPQCESLTNSPACASNEDGYVVQAQIVILSPKGMRGGVTK